MHDLGPSFLASTSLRLMPLAGQAYAKDLMGGEVVAELETDESRDAHHVAEQMRMRALRPRLNSGCSVEVGRPRGWQDLGPVSAGFAARHCHSGGPS